MAQEYYTYTLPDGKWIEVPVEKTVAEAKAWAMKNFPDSFPKEKKEGGFVPSLVSATKDLFAQQKLGIGSFSDEAAAREEYRKAKKENEVPTVSWEDVKNARGVGDTLSAFGGWARDTVAQTAPYMAQTMAGARVGAGIGAAVPIPGSTLVGAGIGGLAANLPAMFGSNLARQDEANPDKEFDKSAAAGAAVVQSGLDAIPVLALFGRVLGINKLAGKALGDLAKSKSAAEVEAAMRVSAAQSLKAAMVKGGVKGAALEMPTELAQQVLERAQAGLPLVGQEAMQEYEATLAGAGLIGGVAGAGVHGPAERAAAQTEVAAKDRKAAADARALKASQEEAYKKSPDYLADLQKRMDERQKVLDKFNADIQALGKPEKNSADAALEQQLKSERAEYLKKTRPLVSDYNEATRERRAKDAEQQARDETFNEWVDGIAGAKIPKTTKTTRDYGPAVEENSVDLMRQLQTGEDAQNYVNERASVAQQALSLPVGAKLSSHDIKDYADYLMQDRVRARAAVAAGATVPDVAYGDGLAIMGLVKLQLEQQDKQAAENKAESERAINDEAKFERPDMTEPTAPTEPTSVDNWISAFDEESALREADARDNPLNRDKTGVDTKIRTAVPSQQKARYDKFVVARNALAEQYKALGDQIKSGQLKGKELADATQQRIEMRKRLVKLARIVERVSPTNGGTFTQQQTESDRLLDIVLNKLAGEEPPTQDEVFDTAQKHAAEREDLYRQYAEATERVLAAHSGISDLRDEVSRRFHASDATKAKTDDELYAEDFFEDDAANDKRKQYVVKDGKLRLSGKTGSGVRALRAERDADYGIKLAQLQQRNEEAQKSLTEQAIIRAKLVDAAVAEIKALRAAAGLKPLDIPDDMLRKLIQRKMQSGVSAYNKYKERREQVGGWGKSERIQAAIDKAVEERDSLTSGSHAQQFEEIRLHEQKLAQMYAERDAFEKQPDSPQKTVRLKSLSKRIASFAAKRPLTRDQAAAKVAELNARIEHLYNQKRAAGTTLKPMVRTGAGHLVFDKTVPTAKKTIDPAEKPQILRKIAELNEQIGIEKNDLEVERSERDALAKNRKLSNEAKEAAIADANKTIATIETNLKALEARRDALNERAENQSTEYSHKDAERTSVLQRQLNYVNSRIEALQNDYPMAARMVGGASGFTNQEKFPGELKRLYRARDTLMTQMGTTHGENVVRRSLQDAIDAFSLRGAKQRKTGPKRSGVYTRVQERGLTRPMPVKPAEVSEGDKKRVMRARQEEILRLEDAAKDAGRLLDGDKRRQQFNEAILAAMGKLNDPVTQADVDALGKEREVDTESADMFRDYDIIEAANERALEQTEADVAAGKSLIGRLMGRLSNGKSVAPNALDALSTLLKNARRAATGFKERRQKLTDWIADTEKDTDKASILEKDYDFLELKALLDSSDRTLSNALKRIKTKINSTSVSEAAKSRFQAEYDKMQELQRELRENLRPELEAAASPFAKLALDSKRSVEKIEKAIAEIKEKEAKLRKQEKANGTTVEELDQELSALEQELEYYNLAEDSDTASGFTRRSSRKLLGRLREFSDRLDILRGLDSSHIKGLEDLRDSLKADANEIKAINERFADVSEPAKKRVKDAEDEIEQLREKIRVAVGKQPYIVTVGAFRAAADARKEAINRWIEYRDMVLRNGGGLGDIKENDPEVSKLRKEVARTEAEYQVEKKKLEAASADNRTTGAKYVKEAEDRYAESVKRSADLQARLEGRGYEGESRKQVKGTYGTEYNVGKEAQTEEARKARAEARLHNTAEDKAKRGKSAVQFRNATDYVVALAANTSAEQRAQVAAWLRQFGQETQAAEVEAKTREIQDSAKKGKANTDTQTVTGSFEGVFGQTDTPPQKVRDKARADFKAALRRGARETALIPHRDKKVGFDTGVPQLSKRTPGPVTIIKGEKSETVMPTLGEVRKAKPTRAKGAAPVLDVDDDSAFHAPGAVPEMTAAKQKAADIHVLKGMTLNEASNWLRDQYKNPIKRALARRVALALDGRGGSVVFSSDPEMLAKPGKYVDSKQRVTLSAAFADNNEALADILMHELVHAATMAGMSIDPDLRAKINALRKRVEDWTKTEAGKAYVNAHSELIDSDGNIYGLKDEKEFTAETFADIPFQELLRQVPDANLTSKPQSAFSRFIQYLAKLFGAASPVELNALTSAVELTEEAFNKTAEIRDGKSGYADEDTAYAPKRVYADKTIGSAADTMIGRRDSALAQIREEATGLSLRVRFVDAYAGIKEALKTGDISKAIQVSYELMMFSQRNHLVAQAVNVGAPVRKKTGKVDGRDMYMVEAENGASLRGVSEALAKVEGYGNHQATCDAFSMMAVALRARDPKYGWDRVFADTPVPKKASPAERAKIEDENRKKAEARATADKLADEYLNGKSPFAAAYREYQEYNKNLLHFVQQAGVISEQDFRDLTSRRNYTPLFRADQHGNVVLDIAQGRDITVGRLDKEPYLRKLLGGGGQVMDFFAASVRNTSLLINEALHNNASREAAMALMAIGAAHPVGATEKSPNIIEFRKDGKLQRFEIDTAGTDAAHVPTDLLVKGFAGVPASMPGVIRMLGVPAQLLRKAVTRNPLYMGRQLVRDPLSAWLSTGADFNPVTATIRELGKTLTGKADDTLDRRGITGGSFYSEDDADIERLQKEISGTRGAFAGFFTTKLDHAAQAADAITRRNVYQAALADGLSEIQATMAAWESMPFAKRGTSPSLRYANHLIPFLSAAIQGWSVLYRSARNDMPMSEIVNTRHALVQRGMVIAALSFLYAIGKQDDDEYKKLNDSERINNWVVGKIKIPVPFELGILFKAIPEAMVRTHFGKDGSDEAKKVLTALVSQAPNVIPTAALPAIEAAMNKSFYSGNPIVGRAMQGLDPSQQFDHTTSELAKLFGKDIDVLGTRIGISPKMLEHVIGGYTGGLFPAIAAIVDTVLPAPAVAKPARDLAEMPVFRSVLVQEDAGGEINRLYDKIEKYMHYSTTFKRLAETNPDAATDYAKENADEIGKGKVASKIKAMLDKISEKENRIRSMPEMSSLEKQVLLKQLKAMKTEVAGAVSGAL